MTPNAVAFRGEVIAAGLVFCMSHKDSGDANVAGPQTMLYAERVLTSLQRHPV